MEDNNNSSLRMSLRERPKRQISERRTSDRFDEMKFMDDFDPEKSNREKRKLKRKINTVSKPGVYDENGRIRTNLLDICDCMREECPGCWYPCSNCGCRRCGLTCRCNRKFHYESISYDGRDKVIKNPYATK